MVKKLTLFLLCLNVVILAFVFFLNLKHGPEEAQELVFGGPITIRLQNRPFTVFEYPSLKLPPRAVILFASGDGGWGGWENSIAHELQLYGYTVVGINSADYAKTDYDLATLQADYNTIAQSAIKAYQLPTLPVIVGGWSMGGAQAIAVAGGPNPPKGLVGVVPVGVLSRGRYGLRISDQADILPTGPETFAMVDFAPGMGGLRVAQWHGTHDRIDSTAWLSSLNTPHREFDYNSDHYFEYASPAFRQKFVESVNWIMQPSP